MGEVNDIAVVGIINDILKYDVSLMFSKVNGSFHVILTWIGKLPDGTSAMGTAMGSDEQLYLALSSAYQTMINPKKKSKEDK